MKFTGTFTALTFDSAGYESVLNKHMTDWLKQAGREWLYAVLTIVPHWSGASRATFETLAAALGSNVPYSDQQSIVDRRGLGASTGTGSELEIEPSRRRWVMKYQTDLRYLAYNEYNRAVFGQAPGVFSRAGIPNTPYHFQEVGAAAFLEFSRFVTLPSPFAFFKKHRIKI